MPKVRSIIVQNQAAPADTLLKGTIQIWSDISEKLWAQPHTGPAVQINIVPAAGNNGQVLTIVGGVPTWV